MRFGSFQTMSWASLPAGASRPDQEAKLVTQILQNQTRGDHRAWVILNAALLLYASGRASSLSKATPLVEQALGSGMASQKLHDLSVDHPMDYDNSGLSPETVHA
jgi:anthranilate phosphoribosyltransferase